MSSQRRSRTTVTSVVRSSARPSVITTTPARTTVVSTTRSSRRRRTRGGSSRSWTAENAVGEYMATLSDPFCYAPLRLGWGTMIPTGIGTAFLRGNQQAGSDGSYGIIAMPFLRNSTGVYGVYSCNAGLASPSWGAVGWSNQAAYVNLASQVRCVSIGLKVYPQVALTAAPGAVYTGALPEMNQAAIGGSTISFLTGSPYLEVGYGNVGAMCTGRPVDPTSYQFSPALADGASGSFTPSFSCPLILFTGLPASCNIVIEAVFNFEYELSSTWNDQVLPQMMEAGAETETGLSSLFPNIETMWNAIRHRLPPVSLTDSISNLARGSAAAALRASGRTLLASASTGSSGRSRVHTALLNGAAAAASSAVYSAGDLVRRNLFGSVSGGRQGRALIEEYASV